MVSFPELPRWAHRLMLGVLWLASLAVAAQRLQHAHVEFANSPTAPEDRQRADGNHGHAEVDFGGQWVMGRMVATGHARELYHRQRQWEIVRAAYPEEAESPFLRRNAFPKHLREPGTEKEKLLHDSEALMDWFMGSDSPRWQEAGPAATVPLAADAVLPNPYAAAALTLAANDRMTPELVAELNAPRIGGPLYPPIMGFLYAPLAFDNNPQQAYYLYQVLTVGLTFAAGLGIAVMTRGRIPWPAAVLAILVYPGYRSGLDLAQNQVLSLTLLIWGWALVVRGRDTLGGAIWGLLAFKPVWAAAFFLVPLLMRRWRFCGAMIATGAALAAATLPFTGIQPWLDWLAVGQEASHLYKINHNWIFLSRDLSGLVRRVMLDFSLPDSERDNPLAGRIAWGLWFAVLGLTAAAYLACGRARFRTGLGAGFLALGAYLCCYRFMYYDALLSVLPMAILFADPRRLLQPAAIELRSAGRTRVGVLNSVPLTLFALLVVLENWLYWFAAEATVRVGAFATTTVGTSGATERTVPGLTAEMSVYYAWDTFILLALWAWCGWRLVVDGDSGEDGEKV